MLDLYLYEIGKLKWVIVVYSVIAIFLYALFMLTTKEFSWTRKKARAFAVLYNFRQNDAIAISLIIGRVIFVFTCVVTHTSIVLGHFICFVLYSIGILLCTRNGKLFVSDLMNNVIVFFLLYIQVALFNYYFSVDGYWPVIAMSFSIGIFSFLEIVLQSITSYEQIMKRRVDNV